MAKKGLEALKREVSSHAGVLASSVSTRHIAHGITGSDREGRASLTKERLLKAFAGVCEHYERTIRRHETTIRRHKGTIRRHEGTITSLRRTAQVAKRRKTRPRRK